MIMGCIFPRGGGGGGVFHKLTFQITSPQTTALVVANGLINSNYLMHQLAFITQIQHSKYYMLTLESLKAVVFYFKLK